MLPAPLEGVLIPARCQPYLERALRGRSIGIVQDTQHCRRPAAAGFGGSGGGAHTPTPSRGYDRR